MKKYRFRLIRIGESEEVIELADKFIILKTEYIPEDAHLPEMWEVTVLEEVNE